MNPFDDDSATIAFLPLPPDTELYRCPLCSGVIAKDDVKEHAAWHENERMRNFTGF